MDFSTHLQICSERVSKALRCFIKEKCFQSNRLHKAIEYAILLGGKRIRPFIVYATGNMFGVSHDILDVPAAAIECIHAYSLIHDDLPAMDNDVIRRGIPTCHIKYGEANAILAGNSLQALAFSILSDSPMTGVSDQNRLAMISELAIASGMNGMCVGQSLDLEAVDQEITVQNLEFIYRRKTTSLIRSAVRLGILSASDHNFKYLSMLDIYADHIGLAFQIQDDILDFIKEDIILKQRKNLKPHLKKKTYPDLLSFKKAQHKAKELIDDAHLFLEKEVSKKFNTSTLKEIADYIIQRDK